MQIRILKLNYSKTTNIYTMGLCVLYYVEYSLFNVKKVGFFYLGWNYTLTLKPTVKPPNVAVSNLFKFVSERVDNMVRKEKMLVTSIVNVQQEEDQTLFCLLADNSDVFFHIVKSKRASHCM